VPELPVCVVWSAPVSAWLVVAGAVDVTELAVSAAAFICDSGERVRDETKMTIRMVRRALYFIMGFVNDEATPNCYLDHSMYKLLSFVKTLDWEKACTGF
jgi:hypothetical protein